ncbi:zf-TFIIB domain-containing protein [Nannocystaceae bacterium ST9]
MEPLPCPLCRAPMTIWQLESGYRAIERWVQACPHCNGAWVDRTTLEELVRNAATLAEQRGTPDEIPRRIVSEQVVYRGCPSCGLMMNRRNFGRISGVIVDECRTCGTWFDEGELESVMDFVRAGGLTITEQLERRDAEREAARKAKPAVPLVDHRDAAYSRSYDLEAELIGSFGRWAYRWLRRIGR